MKLKSIFSSAVVVTALAPVLSFAAEGDLDLSSLTDSFSVTTVVTGVLAISAGLMGLYLAIKGAKVILTLVRGG